MKNTLLLFFCLLMLSCSVRKKDDSLVLARVNNQVLTVNKLELLLPPESRTDDRLRNFIHEWVDNAVLFDAAVKAGLHRDNKLLDEKDNYFKKLVIGAFLQSNILPDIEITNKQIRDYYDLHADGFRRLRPAAMINHFITDNHSDARLIQTKLLRKNSGDSIDELFKEFGVESKTVKRGRLIKELDNAIFKKSIKSVIGPIKSENGYHVIDVLKRYKSGSRLGMEDVYDEIYQRLLVQRRVKFSNDLIDSLRIKTNVFINTNYN